MSAAVATTERPASTRDMLDRIERAAEARAIRETMAELGYSQADIRDELRRQGLN